MRRDHQDFFDKFSTEAREILYALIEKYSEHGAEQMTIPEVFDVPPISNFGNAREIKQKFGGIEKLVEAFSKLQHIYMQLDPLLINQTKELFNDSRLSLPRSYAGDFEEAVSHAIDGFCEVLQKSDFAPDLTAYLQVATAQARCTKIYLLNALHYYFLGQLSNAYNCFKDAIRHVEDHIRATARRISFFPPGQLLYRARVHEGSKLDRDEIFHIPFEKRLKVSSQRYSVPGLPCLYMSGSTYTCWAEMGEPAFHSLVISSFWTKPKSDLIVLDFSTQPEWIVSHLDNADSVNSDLELLEQLRNNLAIWPILASCSFLVKDRTGHFKPEWIFPQMLMQWVLDEREIDGIAYSR